MLHRIRTEELKNEGGGKCVKVVLGERAKGDGDNNASIAIYAIDKFLDKLLTVRLIKIPD